jgi:hypothetical protein
LGEAAQRVIVQLGNSNRFGDILNVLLIPEKLWGFWRRIRHLAHALFVESRDCVVVMRG